MNPYLRELLNLLVAVSILSPNSSAENVHDEKITLVSRLINGFLDDNHTMVRSIIAQAEAVPVHDHKNSLIIVLPRIGLVMPDKLLEIFPELILLLFRLCHSLPVVPLA